MAELKRGERENLPLKRHTETYTLALDGVTMELGLGFYPDRRLGELWIDCMRVGSDVRYFMGQFAIQTSKLLQFGAPLSEAVGKLGDHRLHPGRISCDAVPEIHGRMSAGLVDAIVQLIVAECPDGKLRS